MLERLGLFTYSHEEKIHAFKLEDEVPADVKQARASKLIAIQQHISTQLNQWLLGKKMRVLMDHVEGVFIGRTEFHSSDLGNKVLITAEYLSTGSLIEVLIADSSG